MDSDYKNSVLEYTEDSSFIDWVKSDFVQHNEKWSALQKNPNYSHNIEEAIDLIQMLEFDIKLPSQKNKSDLLARINDTIDAEKTVASIPDNKSKTRRLIWLAGIAASLLLIFAIFLPKGNPGLIQTDLAENELINLPDNSTIHLSAASKLTYNHQTYNKERNINLQGEAFFDVEKGAPFEVKTELGSVSVLGTSFNIVARDNAFVVSCETGRVRVALNNSKQAIILSPNEKCFLDGNRLIKAQASFKSDDWIKGIFHFKGTKLGFVIEELERQFGIKIKPRNVNVNVDYTGFFDKNDLEKSLQSVFWTLGIEYRMDDDNNVLLSK